MNREFEKRKRHNREARNNNDDEKCYDVESNSIKGKRNHREIQGNSGNCSF